MKPVPRAMDHPACPHLSQEEFAARFHIHRTLRDWEQGRKERIPRKLSACHRHSAEVVRKACCTPIPNG